VKLLYVSDIEVCKISSSVVVSSECAKRYTFFKFNSDSHKFEFGKAMPEG